MEAAKERKSRVQVGGALGMLWAAMHALSTTTICHYCVYGKTKSIGVLSGIFGAMSMLELGARQNYEHINNKHK